jgi:hypothetical protein
MNRRQRTLELSRWITTRAEVILLMRRALASAPEALLDRDPTDDTEASRQPAPSNALPMPVVNER